MERFLKKKNKSIHDAQIVLGEHDLTDWGEGSLGEKAYSVASYNAHEHYNHDTTNNDIAIVQLTSHVDLKKYIPACLAMDNDHYTFDWQSAWVYGEIITDLLLYGVLTVELRTVLS